MGFFTQHYDYPRTRPLSNSAFINAVSRKLARRLGGICLADPYGSCVKIIKTKLEMNHHDFAHISREVRGDMLSHAAQELDKILSTVGSVARVTVVRDENVDLIVKTHEDQIDPN